MFRVLFTAVLFYHGVFADSIPDPTLMSMELITPPEQLIAGDTIAFRISIDGPNPPPTGWKIIVQDAEAPTRPELLPRFIVGGKSAPINIRPDTSSFLYGRFDNGVDTVKMIFYETLKELVHNLYFFVDRWALNPVKFAVRPAMQIRLILGTVYDTLKVDSLVLHPMESATLYAYGFDRWGNNVGSIQCCWRTIGALPAIGTTQPCGPHLYYSMEPDMPPGAGYIIATSQGDTVIADSIRIITTNEPRAATLLPRRGASRKNHPTLQRFDIAGRRLAADRHSAVGGSVEPGKMENASRVTIKVK